MADHLEPCAETVTVGPFLFECAGHIYDEETLHRLAHKYHGGKITHNSTSPEHVGDVDVTFWTWASPEVDQ